MNEIIAEIHRHREQVARACSYDAKKLMDHYRRREKESAYGNSPLVWYAPSVLTDDASPTLREEPPKREIVHDSDIFHQPPTPGQGTRPSD